MNFSRASACLFPFALFLMVECYSLNVRGQNEPATGAAALPESIEALPVAPKQYFNDYAGVTTAITQKFLNDRLASFDKKTTNQVLVAIYKHITSTAPLADYCTQIFNKWKVGQKGRNNGVVLFVFMDDHKLRIATGLGMETLLPDQECKRIIERGDCSCISQHDFDGGLTSGVEAIINLILSKQTSVPAPHS